MGVALLRLVAAEESGEAGFDPFGLAGTNPVIENTDGVELFSLGCLETGMEFFLGLAGCSLAEKLAAALFTVPSFTTVEEAAVSMRLLLPESKYLILSISFMGTFSDEGACWSSCFVFILGLRDSGFPEGDNGSTGSPGLSNFFIMSRIELIAIH
jgi:hypothetical protein